MSGRVLRSKRSWAFIAGIVLVISGIVALLERNTALAIGGLTLGLMALGAGALKSRQAPSALTERSPTSQSK